MGQVKSERQIQSARRNMVRAREGLAEARVAQERRRHEFVAFILRCNALGMNDREVAEMLTRNQSALHSVIQTEMKARNARTRVQLFLAYIADQHITNAMVRTMPTREEILYFTDMPLRPVRMD